jgi:hypothetical protein
MSVVPDKAGSSGNARRAGRQLKVRVAQPVAGVPLDLEAKSSHFGWIVVARAPGRPQLSQSASNRRVTSLRYSRLNLIVHSPTFPVR